jgi:hypothetical protein
MLTPRQEKIQKKINKLSSKQKAFLKDSLLLAPKSNFIENKAPVGMVRHKDTYINDDKEFKTKSPKKGNYPPKKLKTQQEREMWLYKKNQKKAEEIDPRISIKDVRGDDQNFGTHDLKGRYIKKIRFGRNSKNPRTPGRGSVIIEQQVQKAQESEYMQIAAPYIETEYTEE